MKSLISIFFLLFPCILWGQQSNRIKGSLVDTCHNPVKDCCPHRIQGNNRKKIDMSDFIFIVLF